MAESKQTTHKVGEMVEVKEGAKVRRPDGADVTVTGGFYVLNQSGTYEVDGSEYKVK